MAYGSESGPLALAHRGGAALAPENTLAAFGLATALGYRYLETDVRVSSDGHLVCFHDATLDRVTHLRGPVSRQPLARLGRLRVQGEPIPTLTDALEAYPRARFTVDLKDRAAIAPLAKVLQHRDFRERVCVAGAWDSWIARVRAESPGVRTTLGWHALAALVTASRAGLRPSRRLATAEYAHVPLRLGRVPVFVDRLVEGAHRIGVRVVLWTLDDPVDMRRALDAGVDGIITDRPDLLREVLIGRDAWSPMHGPRPTTPRSSGSR